MEIDISEIIKSRKKYRELSFGNGDQEPKTNIQEST